MCSSIKWYAILHCQLYRSVDDFVQAITSSFRTDPQVLADISEFDIHDMRNNLNSQLANFRSLESGWNLVEIIKLELHIGNFRPLAQTRGALQRGSSYIPTPPELVRKQAIINVQNTDNCCFMYAVLSALHSADKHSECVSKYTRFIDLYNWSDLTSPVPLKYIRKFERNNPNLRINVYVLERRQMIPAFITRQPPSR